jgi:5-methylthioadenosine/S-adenosylhomocysteine deaminase
VGEGLRDVQLIVEGAQLVTMDTRRRVLDDHSIAVDEGTIIDIAPADQIRTRYRAQQSINASTLLALPGLVNSHAHLFQLACRGLGSGSPLSEWTEKAIWPVAARLDGESCEAFATLSCVELIESGVTTIVDSHYLHRDEETQEAVARACLGAGVRAILGRASADLVVPRAFRESPEVALGRTERFMARWNDRAGRISVRPEALNEVACSPEMITSLHRFAAAAGVGFHMHASETRERTEGLAAKHGRRTIEYLEHLGVLGPGVLLAHCVWLTANEIEVLRRTGASVAHNPISNAFLADGIAPMRELLRAGVPVGLGTDGAASSDALDMFEVMKAALLFQRVRTGDANAVEPYDILAAATIGAARAIGLGDATGSLEIGKKADILLLSLDSPRTTPARNVVTTLVLNGCAALVDTVIVAGVVVASAGKCVSVDRVAAMSAARDAAATLDAGSRTEPLTTMSR